MVFFIGAYSALFKGHVLKLGRAVNINVSSAMQISQEALRGFKEIKALGISDFFLGRYSLHLRQLAKIAS